MEVKATCVYNLKALQASLRSQLIPRACFVLGYTVLTLLFAVWGRPYVDSFLFYLLLFLCLILLGQLAFQYFLLPGVMFKQSGSMQNAINYYLFTDECFQIYSKSLVAESRAKVKYEMLTKVKETKEYLFLYRNKREAWVIDKASIAPGELPLLRNRLRTAGIYDCKLCNS